MSHGMRRAMASAIGFLAAIMPAQVRADIEQPKFDIIKQADGVELRQYAPHLVAEVTVEAASMAQASSKGFMPLANYIFGDNQSTGKIAMTAPVTTQAQNTGETIAMTAPVTTTENADGAYLIRFSMPSQWTLETLPKPNNENVKLIEVPAEKRVAYRFVGARSEALIDEATAKIREFMTMENLTASTPIIIAGYDGPSVPMAKKRWEVMQIVD